MTPQDAGGSELESTRTKELEAAHSKELAPYTPRPAHGHETKFRLIYAVLGGMGLAAVAAAVIFVIAGKPPTPPPWSSWKPSAGGDEALSQIADHVAPTYRLPTGEQLVAVDGGPAEVAGLPVKIVLLRTPTQPTFTQGKSAMFSLCGLGKFCSIKVGKPSQARTLLLEREALELALYTFRYVGDVDQVVVILPPAPHKKPSQAVFISRNEVKGALDQPLRATLAPKPPSLNALRKGPAKDFIVRNADSRVYNYDLTQAPDASVLLELARFNLNAGNASAGSSPGTP
ncbi:MAG TPA: hypothetical protein VF032_10535 [Thermoleophilaceae bacterium]